MLIVDIYNIFLLAHPEDAGLWRELAGEEEHYAALIKAFENFFPENYHWKPCKKVISLMKP